MTGGYHLTAAERLTQRQWHGSGRVAYLGIDTPLHRRSQRLTHGAAARPWPTRDENGSGATPTYPRPP